MSIVADLTMFCVKLSALLFLLKLFGGGTSFRHSAYLIIAVQVLFYLASTGVTLGLLLLCTAKNGTTHAFCTQTYKLFIAQRVFGVITDILVVGMPVVVVWRLSIRRKVRIISLFMTGSMQVKPRCSHQGC